MKSITFVLSLFCLGWAGLVSGAIYGGLQESQGQGIILWQATSRQTWAATAYLRMILMGLIGLRFDPEGIRFQPCVPKGISFIELCNLKYRGMRLDVTIRGTGTLVKQCTIDGKASKDGFLAAQEEGHKKAILTVAEK